MSSRSALTFDAAAAAARALRLQPSELQGESLRAAAAATWAGLGIPERAAIAALVELGGSASSGVLEDETALQLQADGVAEDEARRQARTALSAAWESGLVSRDRASRTFYALPAVASAFLSHVREDLVARLPAIGAPPALLDDHLACCAVNVLRHEPLKLTREGTPFRRGLETLTERLQPLLPRGKDAVARVEELVAQLRELGLLRLSRDVLEIDAEAVETWASLDDAGRAALLLRADAEEPAVRLLRLLLELGPDRAWPEAQVRRVLRRTEAATSEDEAAGPVTRAHDEREAAAAVSALQRAGLLAPAPSPAPADSWALTPAGRSFPAPPDLPRPKGLHVGHDLSVLVPRGLPPSVHARLGDVARLESADQVARYRLDRQAVLEALDRGTAAGELELFLAENATPVLPDAVRDDLRRWAERFGEVTSRAGVCVTCSSPRRHDEFEAVVRRSGLSIALVAPGVAVVAQEDHAALFQLLSAAGLTPRRRVQPLPRGAASAVPPRDAAAFARLPPASDAGELAAAVASSAAFAPRFRDPGGRKAAPPPTIIAAQVKEKYRREFGSGQLAALDRLDVDELITLEEKGLVRQFLAGKIPAPSAETREQELDEYVGDELVSVTPQSARRVMEQAARAGLTLQLAYLQGPGRTQKLLASPLEIVTDGAGTYVRARIAGHAQERMLATDRIHAVRVVRSARP